MRRRMTRKFLILALLTVIVPWGFGGPAAAEVQPRAEESFDEIRQAVMDSFAKVKPALVRIKVVGKRYSKGREIKYESVGSGVIITKEGHVITNHHVAGKVKRITCTLSNRKEIEAELIGSDPLADICVIKLRSEEGEEFPVARFGDSSLIKVGDRVLAMGSPYALSQSVTMGIVSNTELVMPKLFWPFTFTLEGEEVGSIILWIGHDAAIYGGNSGGPLVNLKGEIVGINEISVGVSGAIPGNLAREVAEEIIRDGKVTRSWIGLDVQPLLKSSGKEEGILVGGTIYGSPAEEAGFLPGDILTQLAGNDVNVGFAEELPIFNQMLMGLAIGEDVEAVVRRDDKRMVLRVTPREREYIRSKTSELKRWGITARNLSLMASKEMKRDDQDGVLVTSTRPGGPCGMARPKINMRDIIVAVDSVAVKNVEELLAVTDKIVEGKSDPVAVVVAFERKKEHHLTVVKVGIDELEDPGREVQKAWLPVGMQVVTKDIKEKLGLRDYTGMRVTQVYAGTSVERAGLQVGDIIVRLDGETIDASEPQDFDVLPVMVRQYKIGSQVTLTILREGKEIDLPVKLEQIPKPPRGMKKYRDNNFGITVRDVTFMDRVKEDWKKDQAGVLVEIVEEGSWGAIAHLAIKDLIFAIDGTPVPDVASLEQVMEGIAAQRPKSVVFQVLRGIHNYYLELEPIWNN